MLRPPASPPGRTSTVITGQVLPGVQTGKVSIVQVKSRLVPPEGDDKQLSPVAEFAVATTLTRPASVGPAALLIRPRRLSVSVTSLDAVGPAFVTSSVKVWISPTGSVASPTDLFTAISAEAVGSLPVTP